MIYEDILRKMKLDFTLEKRRLVNAQNERKLDFRTTRWLDVKYPRWRSG